MYTSLDWNSWNKMQNFLDIRKSMHVYLNHNRTLEPCLNLGIDRL